MFFLDWSGGIYGDWKYKDSFETVFLSITKNNVEIVFDEYEPSYYSNTRTFRDWGIRGDINVNEHDESFEIYIIEMYRYFANWWYTPAPPNWRRTTIGVDWYTSVTWPWTPPYDFTTFASNYPGTRLGATPFTVYCSYWLDGDILHITFDPGGADQGYEFRRQ
jgi:hypothetical protein